MAKQSLKWRALRWLDQGLNVWFGGVWNRTYRTNLFGNEDELVSSVLGKLQREGNDTRFRQVIDGLFLIIMGQDGHCKASIEDDEGVRA